MKTILSAVSIICFTGLLSHQPWGHETVKPSNPGSGNLPSGDHDFHVSKCLVEYNEGEQALQMSLHLFIDDLEEALRRQGADNLFICTRKEDEHAEAYIYRYLQENFRFEVNGKERDYVFIGKEVSEDLAAVWCYLEITGVSSLKELKVNNSILMEVFDDQKNLVSVNGPGRKQGLLLFQKGDTMKRAEF